MKNSDFFNIRNFIYKAFSPILALALVLAMPFASFAETTDYEAAALARKELPIQSNEISGWPEGPSITAQAAVLMDARTGTILYAKNIHEELYPASTTKIMTCLLAAENCSLDEKIEFTNSAIDSVPRDGSNIGMDIGQSISLEQALYGIMVGSANEVANAVAEHVGGSIDKFVKMMNDKATELGCTNTHFNNANGLQDSEHYTSVYDLALISREFFNNELLCKVGNTARYHFTPTATQPDDFYIRNKHKLINGEISYEGIVGGKTGFTDLARETLVTCAERDGMRLVCVVFMEESPAQFNDTVSLFDYGFNNFHSVNVSDNDKRYMPNDSLFFESEHDVFGFSGNILSLDEDSNIILPKTSSIEDSTYDITYDLTDADLNSHPTAVAKVNYHYQNADIGSAYICYSSNTPKGDETIGPKIIYINVKLLFLIAILLVVLITLTGALTTRIAANRKLKTKHDRIRYNRRKRESRRDRRFFKKRH